MTVPEFIEWVKVVADCQDITGSDALKLVSIIEQLRQALRDAISEVPPNSFARKSINRALDIEVHKEGI